MNTREEIRTGTNALPSFKVVVVGGLLLFRLWRPNATAADHRSGGHTLSNAQTRKYTN